jgi:hypothetical protein
MEGGLRTELVVVYEGRGNELQCPVVLARLNSRVCACSIAVLEPGACGRVEKPKKPPRSDNTTGEED